MAQPLRPASSHSSTSTLRIASAAVAPPEGMLSGYIGDEGSPTAGAEDYPDTPDSTGSGYVDQCWSPSSDSGDESDDDNAPVFFRAAKRSFRAARGVGDPRRRSSRRTEPQPPDRNHTQS